MGITGDRSLFSTYASSSASPSIQFGDGVVQRAVGSGSVVLSGEGLRAPITLHHVLLVPHCPVNLISVHAAATSLDCNIAFTSDRCIATAGSEILWSVPSTSSGVYTFESFPVPTNSVPAFSCEPAVMKAPGLPLSSRSANLWHRRLGHPGYDAYQRLVSEQMVEGCPVSSSQVKTLNKVPCDTCCRGKAIRQKFPLATRVVRAPMERLHLDLMGPFSTRGMHHEYYVLVLVDEFSGYGVAVPLISKDLAPRVVQTLVTQWLTLLTGMSFKCLRSDRAKEFLVGWFEDWLRDMGTVHELSVAYTPQQNGNAERFNGHVAGIARSLLIESKLAKFFWPYAFTCAAFLKNRQPTQGGATPHFLFFGVKPDVSFLRVFGSLCYATLVAGKYKKNKLGPRAVEGRLLGYSSVSKGYLVWVPALRTVIETRDCVFYEEFDAPPTDGNDMYDGSSFFDAAAQTVNLDAVPEINTSLQDLPPQTAVAGAGLFNKSRLRRPAAMRAVSCLVEVPDMPVTNPVLSHRPIPTTAPPYSALKLPVVDSGISSPNLLNNPLFEEDTVQPSSLQAPEQASQLPVPEFSFVDSALDKRLLHEDTGGEATFSEGEHNGATTGVNSPGWGYPAGQLHIGGDGAFALDPSDDDSSQSSDSFSELTPISPDFVSVSDTQPQEAPLTVPPPAASRTSARLAAQRGHIPGLFSSWPFPAYISHPQELTYASAMAENNPHRDDWLLAMKDEISSLESHGTWVLTPYAKQHILDVRWIFTKKMGAAGQVERFKARFVAKGFNQRPGTEYTDVYAPVTSKTTLRVLLAVVATKRMFICQLDIKTAFLLGTLDPDLELFCEQPPGFKTTGPNGARLVCKLVRSLYGLKQAPRIWSKTMAKVLVRFGYRPSKFDPALFVLQLPNGEWSYVITYVDDFLVCVHDLALYVALVAAMNKAGWVVKEMGLPKQFLSLDMQFTLDPAGRCLQIHLSQHSAITDLLERFPMELKARSAITPMISCDIAVENMPSPLLPNNHKYISLIGSFIYLSTCTRADISFAVSILSRFSAAPTVAQWLAAKRLLQYLRDNKHLGLCYMHNSTPFKFTVFSDSSFAESKSDRKSQSGVAILAAGSLVSWMSKKQVTTALATAEAEYQALSTTAREVMWLKRLSADLGYPCLAITIQCDSTGAIDWTNEYKLEPKAKHIDVIHHYIKELVSEKRLQVVYVNTKDNQADPFTKALAAPVFWPFLKRNGIVVVVPK